MFGKFVTLHIHFSKKRYLTHTAVFALSIQGYIFTLIFMGQPTIWKAEKVTAILTKYAVCLIACVTPRLLEFSYLLPALATIVTLARGALLSAVTTFSSFTLAVCNVLIKTIKNIFTNLIYSPLLDKLTVKECLQSHF